MVSRRVRSVVEAEEARVAAAVCRVVWLVADREVVPAVEAPAVEEVAGAVVAPSRWVRQELNRSAIASIYSQRPDLFNNVNLSNGYQLAILGRPGSWYQFGGFEEARRLEEEGAALATGAISPGPFHLRDTELPPKFKTLVAASGVVLYAYSERRQDKSLRRLFLGAVYFAPPLVLTRRLRRLINRLAETEPLGRQLLRSPRQWIWPVPQSRRSGEKFKNVKSILRVQWIPQAQLNTVIPGGLRLC